jgi:hypothetical protein
MKSFLSCFSSITISFKSISIQDIYYSIFKKKLERDLYLKTIIGVVSIGAGSQQRQYFRYRPALRNNILNQPNVKNFVKDECRPTMIPEKHGACLLSAEQHQKEYMLIYYELGRKGWNIEHVIAHEIAHAYLGHRCDQQKDTDEAAVKFAIIDSNAGPAGSS